MGNYYQMKIYQKRLNLSLSLLVRPGAPPGGGQLNYCLVKLTLALFDLQKRVIPLWKALEKLVRMDTTAKVLLICST